jgi:hypothetical protein
MSLTYTYSGTWAPTSITYSSGDISWAPTLAIDFGDDNPADITLSPGTSLATGPFTVAVVNVDDDVYVNDATLTCTVSGGIPFTGTSTGTLTCTGRVNFLAININSARNPGTDITVGPIGVSGSGPVTITSTLPTVSISGTISVTSTPVTLDFDNDGNNDDRLTIVKTVSISASGTISGTTLTLGPGSSYTVGGADNIDINNAGDPPIDIQAPETGGLNLNGATITLSVPPALSGIIFDGIVLDNEFFIAHEGVEQVHLEAELELQARTQVGSNPAVTTTLFVSLWGHGSITHLDVIEVTGWAEVIAGGPFNFPLGPDDIFAEGAFSLQCTDAGLPSMICDLSIDFDGSSVELGLPISGTIVINFLETSLDDSGTGFFSMEEFERMIISGEIPEDGDNIVVGQEEPVTDSSVTLEGGILSVGPIVKASITSMFFGGNRHSYSLGGIESFDPMVIEGTASGTTIAGISIPPGEEADFSITLNQPVTLDISSFIVPLQDMSNDDRELDDRLFGGYDDFALTGTGMVYITAWVHDIAFKPVDNMGNTLPASNTAVTLVRYNGGPITRGSGTNPDQFQSNLAWSYSQWAGAETGYAIFYQLPGDQAYGVTVTFDNRPVYDEPFEIEKLTETVIAKLVTQVYKLKLVVIDCTDTTVPEAWIKYVEPAGRTVTTRIDSHGALDFGLIGGGEITVKGIWWKGVWIGFDKATIGSTELPVARRRLSKDNNRQKHRLTNSPQSSPKRLHIHNMGLQQRQQNTTPQHNTGMGGRTPANQRQDVLPRDNGPDRRHQRRPIQHNNSRKPVPPL